MKKKVLSGLLALALVVTSGVTRRKQKSWGRPIMSAPSTETTATTVSLRTRLLRRWTRSMRSRFSRETRYFLKKDLYLKTRRFISRAAEAKRHLLSCLLMERGTDRRLIPTDMVSGIRITEATWTIRTISGKAPSPPLSCLWM